MKKKILISIFFLFFITSWGIIFSQLPEWKFFRDRDGNEFFIDQNSKIWTPSKPVFKNKAVSLKGINFYISYAKELIQSFYYQEGLTILKSIISMPVNNNLVRKAQIEAVEEIHRLKKNNGKRYEKLNEEASILLYKKNNKTVLINDLMKYEFVLENNFEIIRKRLKNSYNYKYQGITIGVVEKSNENTAKKKYRYLVAIDSEKFSKNIGSVEYVEKVWRSRLGFENFKKTKIISDDKRLIYNIENKINPVIKGYEGFFLQGKYTHIIRIISSKEKFIKNNNMMKDLILKLKLN